MIITPAHLHSVFNSIIYFLSSSFHLSLSAFLPLFFTLSVTPSHLHPVFISFFYLLSSSYSLPYSLSLLFSFPPSLSSSLCLSSPSYSISYALLLTSSHLPYYMTQVLSPLAAVDNVAALQNGILASSSLSMTSRDSFLLWEEISKLFPAAAVEKLSPYIFFGTEERITLQVLSNLYQKRFFPLL